MDLDLLAVMSSLTQDQEREVTLRKETRDQAADVVTALGPAPLDTRGTKGPMENTGTKETIGITGTETTEITETVVEITATATTETAEEVDPVNAALAGAGVLGATAEGEWRRQCRL